MAKLLHFHAYRPGVTQSPPSPDRCAAAVPSPGLWGHWHQCPSKGSQQYGGHIWCGRHFPPSVHEKRNRRVAQLDKESKAKQAAWDHERKMDKFNDAAVAALRKIAKGHNDPGKLARAVLAKEPT